MVVLSGALLVGNKDIRASLAPEEALEVFGLVQLELVLPSSLLSGPALS